MGAGSVGAFPEFGKLWGFFMTEVQPATKKRLAPRNIIGYALGDCGGVLAFGVISSFLQMYYTDVLHITPGKIAILMLIARVWDAINDPMMGAFLDSRPPRKGGRFRPYVYMFSFPMILSLILIFAAHFIPGMSATQYLIYAYITYIFYGMMYTGVNIPYGSMATVMTEDTGERSTLSVARTFGAGVGQMAGSILLPLFVYSTASTGAKYLDGNKLFIGALIIAIIMLIVYQLNYRLTRETIVVDRSAKRESVGKSFVSLFKNRPFISLSIASMLLITGNMYCQTLNNYLFKNYFETPKLYSMVTIATYLPIAIMMFGMTPLIKKFGKKELCAIGAAIAVAGYLVLFFAHIENPKVFLAFLLIIGFGISFFTLEVWALVSDAIDYQEKLTKTREEGTSYAIFSFFRKLGQTIAGVGSSAALSVIGYNTAKNVIEQTTEVNNGIYTSATLIPAFFYLAIFLILWLWYPLTRDKVEELHADLAKQRKEMGLNMDADSQTDA